MRPPQVSRTCAPEAALVVAVVQVAHSVVGDVEVGVAIEVEIAGDDPQALAEEAGDAQCFGDVAKAVAVVAIVSRALTRVRWRLVDNGCEILYDLLVGAAVWIVGGC